VALGEAKVGERINDSHLRRLKVVRTGLGERASMRFPLERAATLLFNFPRRRSPNARPSPRPTEQVQV